MLNILLSSICLKKPRKIVYSGEGVEMTDRSIIELLLNRDESGIKEAQRQYGQRLIRIAEGLLSKEDAEECVSDTFMAAWNHIPPDEPDHLMPYLTRILKNLARDRWKAMKAAKRNAEVVQLSEELADCIPDPAARTEDEMVFSMTVRGILNRFLARQSRTRRELFILRYWYGEGLEEIAEQYGFSRAKTEKILYRMRDALKKVFEEEMRDEEK